MGRGKRGGEMSTQQRVKALERNRRKDFGGYANERELDAAIQRELDKMTPERQAAFLADFAASLRWQRRGGLSR